MNIYKSNYQSKHHIDNMKIKYDIINLKELIFLLKNIYINFNFLIFLQIRFLLLNEISQLIFLFFQNLILHLYKCYLNNIVIIFLSPDETMYIDQLEIIIYFQIFINLYKNLSHFLNDYKNYKMICIHIVSNQDVIFKSIVLIFFYLL